MYLQVARPRSTQEVIDLSITECSGDAERPSKIRRLSDDLNVFGWLQDDQTTPCALKGKMKSEKLTMTPLGRGENATRRNDYSAFKGRGRYSGQIQ
jgi:hypothetical protein